MMNYTETELAAFLLRKAGGPKGQDAKDYAAAYKELMAGVRERIEAERASLALSRERLQPIELAPGVK